MTISRVMAHSFRNLTELDLHLIPQFNIFYGQNAAGKTSLLELVYYLGLARSFRTHQIDHIIRYGADSFVLHAELNQLGNSNNTTIGIERRRNGQKRVHINGESADSLATLAKLLPLKLIGTDTYRFFYDGPKVRRQYLDWGVFHVKHSYQYYWRQLQLGLKQRNSGIRQGLNYREIVVWDEQLAVASEQIDSLRQEYITLLQPFLDQLLKVLLQEQSVELCYYRGWNNDIPLLEVLQSHFPRDQKQGFTQCGPHRADLQLFIGKTPANEYLSQGQQKVVTYALHLAQGQLLQQCCAKPPIYLIDDLASELDDERLNWLCSVLLNMKAQVLMTAIHINSLHPIIQTSEACMFHVKHGQIQKIGG